MFFSGWVSEGEGKGSRQGWKNDLDRYESVGLLRTRDQVGTMSDDDVVLIQGWKDNNSTQSGWVRAMVSCTCMWNQQGKEGIGK